MFLQQDTTEIAAKRGRRYEEKETPIPPAIEDITGHDNQQILPLVVLEDEPIEQKDDG